MKKFLAVAALFSLSLGIGAGLLASSHEEALAALCVYEDNAFYYWKETTICPDEGGKGKNRVDMVGLFSCLGYYYGTSTPCMCTFVACVKDPFAPNPGID